MITIRALLILAGAIVSAGSALGEERLPGPFPAQVERVVDGDTLKVRIAIWLGQELRVTVRIRGIDAPELRGRCESERDRGGAAGLALGQLLVDGQAMLSDVEGDKYFGRVVADVATPAGADVAAALLAGGHARPYDGGRRDPWCEPEMTGSLPDAAGVDR